MRMRVAALYEVGRYTEGLWLNAEVTRIYTELGAQVELGRALLMKGRLYLDSGRPLAAARCNLEALRSLKCQEPRLLMVAIYNLAMSLEESGQVSDALLLLVESASLHSFMPGIDGTRVRWLRARLAEAMGDVELAEVDLRHVQKAMMGFGLGYDAALASLELAALLLKSKPGSEEVNELLQAAYVTFIAHDLQLYALAVVPLLHEHARGSLTSRLLKDAVVTKLGKPA